MRYGSRMRCGLVDRGICWSRQAPAPRPTPASAYVTMVLAGFRRQGGMPRHRPRLPRTWCRRPNEMHMPDGQPPREYEKGHRLHAHRRQDGASRATTELMSEVAIRDQDKRNMDPATSGACLPWCEDQKRPPCRVHPPPRASRPKATMAQKREPCQERGLPKNEACQETSLLRN